MTEFKNIVELIYRQMEQSDSNWQMLWHGKKSVPVNIVHGRSYQGINRLLLWSRASESGFKSRHWGTFNQWRRVKQPVQKGAKATTMILPRIEKNAKGEEELKGFLRFWVFNGDQVLNRNENHPDMFGNSVEKVESVEKFVKITGAIVRHGADNACYKKHKDIIEIPDPKSFIPTPNSTATQNYYSTLLHELVHWTGHPNRENRKPYMEDNVLEYAFEELVAELGGAFLCSDFNLEDVPRTDHAQYLKSWLSIFSEKPLAFWRAASLAQAAVNYIKSSVPAEPERDESTPEWFVGEPVQIDLLAPEVLGTGRR